MWNCYNTVGNGLLSTEDAPLCTAALCSVEEHPAFPAGPLALYRWAARLAHWWKNLPVEGRKQWEGTWKNCMACYWTNVCMAVATFNPKDHKVYYEPKFKLSFYLSLQSSVSGARPEHVALNAHTRIVWLFFPAFSLTTGEVIPCLWKLRIMLR